MASTVLGNRDASEHKTDKNYYPSGAYNRVEESDNKHNKDVITYYVRVMSTMEKIEQGICWGELQF